MKKPTITHYYPLILLILFILAFFIWSCFLIVDTSKIVTAEGSQNSECQYPLRSTNPPGGCDNFDPCDPMNAAKGGSGECLTPVFIPPDNSSEFVKTVEKPVDTVDNLCAK